MLKFTELLNSGGSSLIVKELDREGNLDHTKLSGEALDDAFRRLPQRLRGSGHSPAQSADRQRYGL
jgi:hypothetical protein